MVVIAEKQKVSHFPNVYIGTESFYEDLDSTETLLKDWELIQESERNYDPNKCMSAEEAYIQIKNYINNLK